MAATITEEVKAVFSADTTGLVAGADRARKALGELKKEYNAKANTVKGSILDPSALLGKGLEKLSGSLKISAVTAGVAGAGLVIAGQAAASLAEQAKAARQQTDALNESIRRLGNENTFSTVAEGASSLAARLSKGREASTALREQERNLNPKNSGGVMGWLRQKADEAALQYKYATTYGIYDFGSGLSMDGFTGNEMLKNDRRNVPMQQTEMAQQSGKETKQVTEYLAQQVTLTEKRLTSSRKIVEIAELEIQRQSELTALMADGVGGNAADLEKVNAKFDLQVAAAKELQTVESRRYQTELAIEAIRASSATEAEKQLKITRLEGWELIGQLGMRRLISTEERRSINLRLEAARTAERFASLARSQEESRFLQAETAARTDTGSGTDEQKRLLSTEAVTSSLREQRDAAKGIDDAKYRQLQTDYKLAAYAQTQAAAAVLVSESQYELSKKNQAIRLSDLTNEERQLKAEQNTLASLKEQAEALKGTGNLSEQRRVSSEIRDSKYAIVQAKAAVTIANSQYELSQKNQDLKLTSLNTAQQQYKAEQNTLASLREQAEALRGTGNLSERRQVGLAIRDSENTTTLAQRAAQRQSGAALNRQFHQQKLDELNNQRTDRQVKLNDGLINVNRDMSGNITSGTDRVTGEQRGASSEYRTRQDGGALRSTAGTLLASMGSVFGSGGTMLDRRPVSTVLANRRAGESVQSYQTRLANLKRGPGTNDQSAGRTALDAARAQVAAINISNAYLKAITEILPTLALT